MMSDGALSQDEIDALLAGVDSSSISHTPVSAPTMAPPAPSGGSFDTGTLEKFFTSITGTLSSNLSMNAGSTVTLLGPQAMSSNRDSFLSQLPDMVTVITANFTSGFPGEHIFIFPEESAKAIASLMTHNDDIQLDDMAMSVISEMISQLVGTQITSLSDKTGNKSIASSPPAAANMPKAAAPLPSGNFAVMEYSMSLASQVGLQMWEILGASPASDISADLGSSGGSSGGMQMPGVQMGGMMPNMGMGQMQGMPMGGMQMPGVQMGGMMPNMGMGQMQGMPMQMSNMPNMGPTNVQPVQFPNLMQPQLGPHESGNIGLIMDVSMEMTVELGRTRKLIKEILGMGEGTIIELDKLAGEPVDILVNHKLIAKGEVVVIDENFGVRVTEIVSPMERLNDMGYN